MRRSRRTCVGMFVGVVFGVTGAAAPADAFVGSVVTYDTPGPHTWTVPAGVTQATFDVYGAQGADLVVEGDGGGLGGHATATLAVTPGSTVTVNVGGRGGLPQGGSNGGGDGDGICFGGDDEFGNPPMCFAISGGGGGATDVQVGGSRLLVAGGGGGFALCNGPTTRGGAGGGLAGGDGSACDGEPGGAGGTQDAGAADGSGGSAVNGGGGGGGGWRGGGAGVNGSAGGGGSGHGPDGTLFETGVRSGDGLATITYTPGAANTPAVANDDSDTLDEDASARTIDVRANDTDADATKDLITAKTDGSHGTVAIASDGTNLTYTPAANYCGPDSFTYKLSGGDTANVSVTVTCVNDAPVVNFPGSPTIDEDTSLTFSSANSNQITVTDVDAGDNDISLALSTSDGIASSIGTIALGSTTGLTTGYVCCDGVDYIELSGTVSEINAALDGYTFEPFEDYNGSGYLVFITNDHGHTGTGGANSPGYQLAITVNPVADTPDAVDDPSKTAAEDSAASANQYDVLANDSDPDSGTAFNITGVSQPSHGTAAIVEGTDGAPDKVSYAPNANYCNEGGAADTFTYTVSDGTGRSATATVSVAVSCVNDQPTLSLPVGRSTDEDTPLTFSSANSSAITIGDVDAGSNSLTVRLTADVGTGTVNVGTSGVTVTGNGTRSVTLSGSVTQINAALDGATFNPRPDYNGSTSIFVEVNDNGFTGAGGSKVNSTSTAVTVSPVPDPPRAANDNRSAAEDSAASANQYDVLANDSDPDSGTAFNITGVSQPSHGTAAIVEATDSAPDKVSYAPSANYCNDGGAADAFTYTVDDGTGRAATVTVTVAVSCVDDATVANDDPATVSEDAAATTIDVRQNDTDIEGSKELITAKTDGAHGDVAIANGGDDLTYVPDPNFCGADSFSYTLAGGDSADVSVTVGCTPDDPVAADDSKTAAEDSVAADNTYDVLANDTDADAGTALDIARVSDPADGTAAIVAGSPDKVSYVPDAGYCSEGANPDTFTYTVDDGTGRTDTATVSVTVACADEPADPTTPTDPGDPVVPGPPAVPETTIGRFPSNPKGSQTHFRFRSSIPGSTFTCQLDREEPESCERRISYRNLEPGRHRFKVFATSPHGVADPTPAKARFRIES